MSHNQQQNVDWVHSGWLSKKGQRNIYSWRNRYFVLYPDRTLCYYKKEADAKSGRKPTGTIDLKKILGLELVSYKDPKTKNLRKSSLPSFSKSKPKQFQHIKKTQSAPDMFTINNNAPDMNKKTQQKTKPLIQNNCTNMNNITALESINEQETVKPPTFHTLMRNNPFPELNGWSYAFNETSNVISSIKPPNDYGPMVQQQLDKDLCDIKSVQNNSSDNIAHRDNNININIRGSISSSATHSRNSSLSVPFLCDHNSNNSISTSNNRSRSYSNISNNTTSTNISDITISNSFTPYEMKEDTCMHINDIMVNRTRIRNSSNSYDSRTYINSNSFDSNGSSVDTETSDTDKHQLSERVIYNSRSGLSCNKKYSFSLIQETRKYILSAETNDISQQWIWLLTKLVQGKQIYSTNPKYGCLALKYDTNPKYAMYIKTFCVLFENKLLHYKDHTYVPEKDIQISNNYNNLPGEHIAIDLRNIIWLRRCIKNEYNDIGLKQLFHIPKVNTPSGNHVINPFALNVNNDNYSLEIAINGKRLIMTTKTERIRNEWYKHIYSVFEHEFMVKMYYNSNVKQSNLRDKYIRIALFEDMLVIFSDKKTFNCIKQMIFFDTIKFKQYLEKKNCTVIVLNDNIKIRVAKNHGDFAFKVSYEYSNTIWYFNCDNQNVLNEWMNLLVDKRMNEFHDEPAVETTSNEHDIEGGYLSNIFNMDIFETKQKKDSLNKPKRRRKSSPLIMNKGLVLTDKYKMIQLMHKRIIGNECMNNLITVYGRNKDNDNTQNNTQNNNDKNGNNNNKNSNNKNNNNNNNNFNGNNNGSNNNNDDEKDNDKNNKSRPSFDNLLEQNKKEQDKQVELYLELLNNMKNMNDNQLKIQLDNFGDNIVKKVRETWYELGNNMQRAESIKNGININTETKIEIEIENITSNNEQLMPPKNNKKRKPKSKKKCKQNKNVNNRNYNPSNTKKMYRIAKKLTEQIIPNRISENINNPFDFMIKSLAINKNNASHFNQYRIFNFNLHDRNTNENLYFIGTPLDPTQNRNYWYSISDLCSQNEMKLKYKIVLHKLPKPIQLKNEFESEMKCVEEIIIKSINTLSKTNWHKIPIYNRTNNKRRMKLYLEKFEFTNYFQQFAQNKTDIELIPIVMFDENEKFYKEYIWIITIETNIKIGISFKYNKKQKSVFINGIHLDKTYLIQQHQLVSPSYIYNDLKHFTSTISHLHIGNPDDYINKINALQNRVDALKNSNDILKRYVRISPFNSNRSIITNMSCSSLDINSDHSLLSLSVNSDTDDTSNITTSLTPLHNNEVTNTNL